MERKAPLGYVWKDENLEVNKKEAEIIKWIYQMITEYYDNPPEVLIRDVMAKNDEKKIIHEDVKELTYEEAKEKVPLSMVERYVAAELNLRMEQYEKDKQEDTPHELQEFLVMQLDKKYLTEIEKRYQAELGIEYYSKEILGNEVNQYIGKIKPQSNQKIISFVTEPIISRELYENVIEKIKKDRDQVPGEEQGYSYTQTLE